MNNLKVFLLMGLLSVILVLIGSAVGGQSGAILFFLISLAMNFFTYYFSDKVAISMTLPSLYPNGRRRNCAGIVRRLAQRAGLPMPRLYVTPSPQPNAFATGRNPAKFGRGRHRGLAAAFEPYRTGRGAGPRTGPH